MESNLEEEVIPNGLNLVPLFESPMYSGKYFSFFTGQINLKTTNSDDNSHLFAHDTWPGAILLSDYLVSNSSVCNEKCILEFGAGSALPSIVSSKLGAKMVVASDYPSLNILAAMSQNFESNGVFSNYSVIGYKWGDDPKDLLSPLSAKLGRFDVILLSELLWKDTISLHE